MRMHRTLVLGASLALLLGTAAMGEASSPLPSGPVGQPVVKMGSAGFNESAVVAEIWAQALEAGGVTVERHLNTGPRDVTWAAMQSGADINAMPEFIGFLLEYINQNAGEASADSAATRTALAARLAPFDMSVLQETPGGDVNAFVVTKATADQYSLASLSDLAKVASQLKWGLPPECSTQPLCGAALKKYGIDISTLDLTELGACGGEIVDALANGGVQVGELCSTQAALKTHDFVVLTDDLGTQPTGALAPIIRNDTLRALQGQGVDVAALLDPVSSAITTQDLIDLNDRTDIQQEDLAVVAKDFLTSKGLLPGSSAAASAAASTAP
jgi:osmoprotectant transport system substrate-binding protein